MPTKRFLTEKDVDYLEERFRKVFATKNEFQKYRSELMNKLDKILGEIIKSREEQTIIGHKIINHEQRITALEKPTIAV